MTRLRLVVLASGRGSNLQAILDSIEEGRLKAEVVAVISDQENAYALERGKLAGVPAFYFNPQAGKDKFAYEKKLTKSCQELNPNYICLAGYMRILGHEFIQSFKDKIINIHPSLLPSFPGLHGQKQALAYGVKVTGCTVHFVDEGMDTGPIIAQRAVPVLAADDEQSLSERILMEEHQLYPLVLQLLQEGRIRLAGRRVIVG